MLRTRRALSPVLMNLLILLAVSCTSSIHAGNTISVDNSPQHSHETVAVTAIDSQSLLHISPDDEAPPTLRRGPLPVTDMDNERRQPVNQYASEFMAENNATALSIAAIFKDGNDFKVSYFNFGVTSSGTPVTEKTISDIASITKVFTACLIAVYASDGAMNLDEPAQKFMLPGVTLPTFAEESITLRHLATHTSGLTRDSRSYASVDAVKSSASTTTLGRSPGQTYEYSNLGFEVLGWAVEAIAGDTYERILNHEIASPLGMEDTVLQQSEEQRSRSVDGRMRAMHQPGVIGSGAIRSTTQDLAIFVAAAMEPETSVLGIPIAETLRQAASGAWGNSGLGWDSIRSSNVRKNGGHTGYASIIQFDRTRGLGVAILGHGPSFGPGRINEFAAGILALLGGQTIAGTSPGPTANQSPDPQIALKYLARETPGPGSSNPIRYKFSVTGYELSAVDPDVINLTVEPPIPGYPAQKPRRRVDPGNILYIYVNQDTPATQYTVTLTTDDGRSGQITFQHLP